MTRLVRYFFHGLIVLVPIAVTAYVLVSVFTAIDGWLGLSTPGLGVLILIATVTVVGALANLFLLRGVLAFVEGLLERLPFIKVLYGPVKDLLTAVLGDEKRFDNPVLITVGEGIELLGFVTCDSLDELGAPDRVAVYLPQSYNFAGQTVIVRRESISPLPAKGADAMTFLISAGVTGGKTGSTAPSP